jgi:hypothetical protein
LTGEYRTLLGDDVDLLPKWTGVVPEMRILRMNLNNRGKPLETFEHDWRVDTRLVLAAPSSLHMVICARCGAAFSGRLPASQSS